MSTFKLRKRDRYPWLFVALTILVISVAYLLFPNERNLESILLALGGVGGFVGFLYSQHREQTRMFRELFFQFNDRYDSLNQRLNAIRRRPEDDPLSDKDKDDLFDYFNLCAEEYLFFRSGYIDEDVWRTWCRGMHWFKEHKRIGELWESELATGSYYGFSFDEFRKLN